VLWHCYNPTLPASTPARPFSALILGRDDTDLIAGIQSRDPQAMGLLYDRYGRPAYSLILRIVNDPAVAEDVLAETFVKVWNRIGILKEDRDSDLGLWILCLARNNAFELLRSTRGWLGNNLPKLNGLENLSLFQETARDRDPSRWHDLENQFASLTDPERQVLELACFDGLSPGEIALRLEQPLANVRVWIASGLAKLDAGIGKYLQAG
jgi:RNA polymerase sigma-70 factor (ECF subfamily)